jgi:ferredoxin-NADP reductase
MIQKFKTTLTKKQQLTSEVWLLTFSLVEPQTVEFQAGQYLITLVPTPDGVVKRLYSVASAPEQNTSVELLVHMIPGGAASEYFLKSNIGDTIMFEGPAGRFLLNQTTKEKVFLATGPGVAPMLSMFSAYLKTMPGVHFHLLWGVPTVKDTYFIDKLKTFASTYPNFTFQICMSREETLECVTTDDQGHFALGRITKDLKPDLLNTEYYICGNRDMVEQVKQLLYDSNVPRESVIFEKF